MEQHSSVPVKLYSQKEWWANFGAQAGLPAIAFKQRIILQFNIFYGILALIGICLGQLATNLFDDYIDYKKLEKLGTLNNQTKSKCKYIKDGLATLNDVLIVVIIYCSIATII